MIKDILFDLDGTLTDSQEGILNSMEYMLDFYGIHVDRDALRPWLGPPLKDCLMKYHGFSREKALEGVDKYREYFDRQGIFENRVFEGVEETLQALAAKGCRLYVATSKPELAAKRVLEHFRLDSYFTYIGGATQDDSRVAKADVIRYVLETNGLTDLSQVLMVGDREHDVAGAKQNGLSVAGVLYGYGSREELTRAGADFIVETPMDLVKLVG